MRSNVPVIVILVIGITAVVATSVHVAAIRGRDGHAHTIVVSGGLLGWTTAQEHGFFTIVAVILGIPGVVAIVIVIDRHLDGDRFLVRVRVVDYCWEMVRGKCQRRSLMVVDVFLLDKEVHGWEDFGDRDLRHCNGSTTNRWRGDGGGIRGVVAVGERLSLSLEERGGKECEGEEVGLAIH